MHRPSLRALSAFALLVLAGCGGAERALSDGGVDDPLAALERDTGQPWTVRWHPDLRTPAWLSGRTTPLAATPADAERAGRAFLQRYRSLYQMNNPDDELAAVASTTDELGMTHARFVQKQGKVPVWGGDLIVHFADDGAIVLVNGRFQPLPSLPAAPARSIDEARVAAIADARAARPEVDVGSFNTLAPKLWIYPTSASDARLAWRVETEVEDLDRPMLLETFVDATDGSILHRVDTLATLDGSGLDVFGDTKQFAIGERRGRYWLEDGARGKPAQKIYDVAGKTRLPGLEVSSPVVDHWDENGDGHGAAVDAQVYVAAAYDYFSSVHGRAGWDGKGKGVHASVHFGDHYANAFFNGKQLVFGDGDGDRFAPLAGALDVVAHEFTHGVTAHTAKLRHEGQSGALNEAVSDIFAAFVAGQSGVGRPWRIGEAVFHPNGVARAIRDAIDPHASGSPATLDEYVDTAEDNGGIHVNSTIVSHAAYLMTEENGLGAGVSARVWYRALAGYLTPRATFADAADATQAAARDLGADDQAVRRAWIAVGVLRE